MPVTLIPHKPQKYKAILDLFFCLKLQWKDSKPHMKTSVITISEKMEPAGAINQLGQSSSRMVHAFAETSNNGKIMMTK